MPNVQDVAQYILEKNGEMSTMKLQKLVYYSQAWHCVWSEEALFNEPIQAWANGPVVPALYESHKGMFTITAGKQIGESNRLSSDQKDSINRVLEFYAAHTAQYLSDLTHVEDPWKKVRGDLAPGVSCEREIPLASLAEYYGSL